MNEHLKIFATKSEWKLYIRQIEYSVSFVAWVTFLLYSTEQIMEQLLLWNSCLCYADMNMVRLAVYTLNDGGQLLNMSFQQYCGLKWEFHVYV